MLRSLLNVVSERPVLCVYDATTRCNSRCAMCGIWKRKEREMTVPEIRKVFSDLKRFGVHTVFLQGGEPLVRRDALEIIELLACMGFRVSILSNGIALDEKFLQSLEKSADRNLLSVTVSLDTLDRKKYRRIRGVDALPKVLGNIRTLSKSGIPGEIHATVTSVNYKELPALKGFAEGLGLKFSFNSYSEAVSYASARDAGLSLSGKETTEKVITEMERVAGGMDILTKAFTDDNVRHLRGEDIGPCDAFRHSLRVTADGRLSPCLELPPVMDLLAEDINGKWDGVKRAAMPRIKACYEKTPCFYGCTRGMGSIKKRPLAAACGALSALRR